MRGHMSIADKEIAVLVQLNAEANAALIRGDMTGYLERIKHAEDYTLMAPFGSAPWSEVCRSRTGRCGSPWYSVAREASGSWSTAMPIRSCTASAWNRQPLSPAADSLPSSRAAAGSPGKLRVGLSAT